ncbi:MAG: Clp protease N-terminal domain-containing protein [Patescibacteria group bacterium]
MSSKPRDVFAGFNLRALEVMACAQQEAQRFNHEHINTEHILLALLKEGEQGGAEGWRILREIGIDLKRVRSEVERLVHPGPDVLTTATPLLTPRANKAVEFADEESSGREVGTGYLLLGLLRHGLEDPEDIAGKVLRNLGLKLEDVREEVLAITVGDLVERMPEVDQPKPVAPDSDVLAGVTPIFHAVSALRARSAKLISLIGFNEHFSTLLISCLIDSTTNSGRIDDRQLAEKLSAALARPEFT